MTSTVSTSPMTTDADAQIQWHSDTLPLALIMAPTASAPDDISNRAGSKRLLFMLEKDTDGDAACGGKNPPRPFARGGNSMPFAQAFSALSVRPSEVDVLSAGNSALRCRVRWIQIKQPSNDLRFCEPRGPPR
nr:hypothetical protein [Tanacetum cinerariifolium]